MQRPACHLRVVFAVALLAVPAVSRADVLCVTPAGGGGCFASIGAALAAATPGDTVRVATGTYVENVVMTEAVTLQGGWDAAFATRDPAAFPATIQPATPAQSVVTIQGAGAAVFEGFVVTGGRADLGFTHGGGLRVVDSPAVVRDNVIAGNRAYLLGGGVWVQRGTPRFVGNRIEGNQATGDATEAAQGGGMALQADQAVLVDNVIRGNAVETPSGGGGGLLVAAGGPVAVRGGAIEENTAGGCGRSFLARAPGGQLSDRGQAARVRDAGSVVAFGGGVFVAGVEPVTVERVRVARNCASHGGGITVASGSRLVLLQSTVTGNGAVQGGGIYIRGGIVEMLGTAVTGNLAATAGGVLAVAGGGLQASNSTLSQNSSQGLAGGLMVFGSMTIAELMNVTVADNAADVDGAGNDRGGGILNDEGVVTLRHTLVAGNRRGVAGLPDDCAGSDPLTLLTYTLIQTPTDCDLAGDFTGSQFGVDPLLGPLAENGGPTPTHALLAGSPARDGIPLAQCDTAVDQRGVPRPQGAACDIGAYEASDVPFLFLRLNESVFGPGDTMVLTAELIPGLVPAPVDAYIVIRLPDGTLLSLVPAGAVPGIAPVATGVVPVLFRGEVVRYTFQGHEPGGRFDWFAALTRTRTLDIVGAVDQDPFTFSP